MSTRPSELPDYANPPLDEVVLGIQFEPVPIYSSVFAKDIHTLFRDDFPKVQELHALPPQFEVFGRDGAHGGPGIKVENAPVRGRLWFVSADDSHLVQFQEDRLLLNWRRRSMGVEYPRFEAISAQYLEYMQRLELFFSEALGSSLNVNQAEATYINLIPLDEFKEAGEWIKLVDFANVDPEGVNLNFTEALSDSDGRPFARLHHEIQSGFMKSPKSRVLRLSMTCRGRPNDPSVAAANGFLQMARSQIVKRFSAISTETAEKKWEKIEA